MRQGMENKCHHHIKEPRTYCKSPSMRFNNHPMKKVSHKRETEVHLWTQSSDMDTKDNQDAIPLEHVVSQNDFQSDYNTCTSNMCNKPRYRGIETVHIGVELLYNYNGTSHRYLA